MQKGAELADLKVNAEQSLAEMAEQLRLVCEERDKMDNALQVANNQTSPLANVKLCVPNVVVCSTLHQHMS